MKRLAKTVEKMHNKVRPLFERGGLFHLFYPIFEAADAFALTPPDVTQGPPHIRDSLDMKRFMMTVIIALIPCTLFGMFNAGYMYDTVNQVADATFVTHMLRGMRIVLPIIIVSYAVGGFWEVLFAVVRKHEINEGLLVTGLLFPLTLPPTIPLWQVAVGISFGVVIGKEIFGGTGFNILNPALTSRAFLYFAYPAQISGDRVWAVTHSTGAVQGYTGATSLAAARAVPPGTDVMDALQQAGFTLKSMIIGLEPGSIGETSAIAILIGLVILLVTGVASWRIITGGLLGTAITAGLLRLLPEHILSTAPHLTLPFYYDLAMGGMFFGIVFMATDPVSAAATRAGKWIYGFLIGFLTIVIRAFNPAYPEGNMLAIIFASIMAPLIDQAVVSIHIRNRTRFKGVTDHA